MPFNDQSAFVLLAIVNVFADVMDSRLSDGTSVLPRMPVDLGVWSQWIGSITADRLRQANVIFLREEHPETRAAAQIQQHFDKELTQLFYMLQLSGVIEYDSAYLLTGVVHDGAPQIQQISDFHTFYPSKGYSRTPITMARLTQAASLRQGLQSIDAPPPRFARVIRGFHTLLNGLTRDKGQDRLHQFVRSLEALILPRAGETKKQFIHRCQTFARPSPVAELVLSEAFDMRSDTEHLHDWNRALQAYPTTERDNIAWHRTRQMEALATSAYSRILLNPALRASFESETDQQHFWKQAEGVRRATWGESLDLTAIPLVTRYDDWNRARL
jgi:hypothetical protein